ncbi:Uncharacterised protein [Staphylococcus nepalensis]|uniref:Uncharacterized protein n=1 Tax=Staphylococcus nepalensis TaxID=214473 RepID=A0A380GJL8_9STAP|nr:hypothetical protein GCM10007203_21800 [Staphylococcus nepalensis]SUM53805.1 Uncharacterised protein [Staphylococcus nepalensis]VDG65729.1 Uncharacterised protein [Lacrimispora indolis]
MKKVYKKTFIFIIYYIIAAFVFNAIIYLFNGEFDLMKSLILPLIVVIISFLFINKEKKYK